MTEWIISTSVLILIFVTLRYILRGKMSLRLQYALWGIVLLRALLPFSVFTSPISVMNAVDKLAPVQLGEAVDSIPSGIEHIEFVPDEDSVASDTAHGGYIQGYYGGNSDRDFPTLIVPNATQQQFQVVEKALELKDAAVIIWMCGALFFGLIFLCTNLRFGHCLRRSRMELELSGNLLPVYICPGIETPCLFGFFSPAVYLTPGCEKDQSSLRHVLAHEFTHYRHGDNIWSILRCLCLALHWYNPLVWLAAFLSVRDAELACDEGAIKRLGEGERIDYGRTLIGMTCAKGSLRSLALTATTMTGSKKGIKERIMLIAKKPRMALYTLIAVLLVAAAAVGCTFSGAQDDKKSDELFTPGSVSFQKVLSSYITHPSDDPELIRELYEIYENLEPGKQIEASEPDYLRVVFHDNDSDDFRDFSVTPSGLHIEITDDGIVYRELEGGAELYEKLKAYYDAAALEALFSPTKISVSKEGWDSELVFEDSPALNELYSAYRTASYNYYALEAEEIEESKVDKSAPIYVTFTDGSTTRSTVLYSDGCFSPEPKEWETQRKYYRAGDYDHCGTQGCYMLFDTYCNAGTNEHYVRDFAPVIVITSAPEDWDMTNETPTTVEYFNALKDQPHTAMGVGRSTTAAIWLLSQKGRFETIYLLNATDSSKRAEWLAENLKLIADNVITDPAEIEYRTGWTAIVEKQDGIALQSGIMLRIDNSISMYESKELISAAGHYIDRRIAQLNESFIEIVDAYLTGITEIPCGYIGQNGAGARIFLLEYRLKPESLTNIFSQDIITDGEWITQETGKGQPYLIMQCSAVGYTGLSAMITEQDLKTTYSTPEMMEKYFNDPYTAACSEFFNLNLLELSPLKIVPPDNQESLPGEVYAFAESLIWSDIRSLNDLGAANMYLMGTFQVSDAEITKLEQLNTGTMGLNEGVNMYRLEYRLRVDDSAALSALGGIKLNNGWLERGGENAMYLLFHVITDGDNTSYDHIVTLSEEALQQYNTDSYIKEYGNMYTAACMEMLEVYKSSFYAASSNEDIIELYSREILSKELYAIEKGEPGAITDYKYVDSSLFAAHLFGDRIVGLISYAVSPENVNDPYFDAFDYAPGEGEYEGMFLISKFVVLRHMGDNRWVCESAGTGGFGGWGYIPMDFESSDAVLATLELWLGHMDGYEENILTLMPLIDWSELERSRYDIELGDLFNAIEHAAISTDSYYTDTYPHDQIYRDLYVMEAILRSDGAYTEFLADILQKQYEHDSQSFEKALTNFDIQMQIRLRGFLEQ